VGKASGTIGPGNVRGEEHNHGGWEVAKGKRERWGRRKGGGRGGCSRAKKKKKNVLTPRHGYGSLSGESEEGGPVRCDRGNAELSGDDGFRGWRKSAGGGEGGLGRWSESKTTKAAKAQSIAARGKVSRSSRGETHTCW